MGVEPLSVRLSVFSDFKHKYLRNQWVDHNPILSEELFGTAKGGIRFWSRSDQFSGFYGNKQLK